MCHKCYQEFLKQNPLPNNPRKLTRFHLVENYGAEFLTDLDRLFKEPFWNLTEMGGEIQHNKRVCKTSLFKIVWTSLWGNKKRKHSKGTS